MSIMTWLSGTGGTYPQSSSTAVCEEYLTGVITRKYYCPKYTDVRLAPCPSKPTKAVLFAKL